MYDIIRLIHQIRQALIFEHVLPQFHELLILVVPQAPLGLRVHDKVECMRDLVLDL